MKLTEKQKRFADYYIETGNASEAYRKAGYAGKSTSTITTNGNRLLTNADIKKYISDRVAEKDNARIAKQDEVLSYLTGIMRGEYTEQTLRGIGEGAQVIADIDVSAKDRIKAAELLGKRYAMWTEKQDIDIKGAVTFVDDIGEEDET
ncbi:terminase small subunit [Peribacillus frigoritolerans]|uniref:terminase small subunit n=1 Tax=Peribacillus frigoritolerans TaxID=450367 RepID=UPI0021635EEE|nr:terminase small subunit [Peribacillus frigoritolerans]